MSGYGAGVLLAEKSISDATPVGATDDTPAQDALRKITAFIPGEALTVYVAGMGAIPALNVDPGYIWLFFASGLAASIVFQIIAYQKAMVDFPKDQERPPWWKVGLTVLLVVIAFCLYVLAMPENPAELAWGWNPGIGSLLVIAVSWIMSGIAKVLGLTK